MKISSENKLKLLSEKIAVKTIIKYRNILSYKLMSFDHIDESLRSKIRNYMVVDEEFLKIIRDYYSQDNMDFNIILYYCVGFVFDEATNGSEFPFLLNDAEFVITRGKAMSSASEICELENEEIEKYRDFGIDYSKRRVSEKMI